MAKARTWILIIFAAIGLLVVALLVMAGVGGMWVMRHVKTEPATATDAVKTFEQELARFGTQKALLSLEDIERPGNIQKKIDEIQPGAKPATDMEILVWSPDSSRIAFWSNREGTKGIFVMDVNGQAVRNISNKPWDEYDPLWIR